MARVVIYKILLLVLIITGLNFIYKFTMYKNDLETKSPELVQIAQSQEQTDVYYFGESSNVTFHPEDQHKNSISEFTSWYYPELKFTGITQYATHAGIYKLWLSAFDEKKKMPSALIITMNLRSFNDGWINSDLETQLQEAIVFARPFPPLLNRFMISLQAFENRTKQEREQEIIKSYSSKQLIFPFPFKYKTVKEWDGAMAAGSYKNPDGTWDVKKIELTCHYVKSYAFNVLKTNPRIDDFDEISAWCRKHDIQLYLNLMAENIAYADSLVGRELVFLMKQNRDFLISRYHKDNCKVVDNLEVVNGKDFVDQNWTTEHYAEAGRRMIARNIADTMQAQFKNQYKIAY